MIALITYLPSMVMVLRSRAGRIIAVVLNALALCACSNLPGPAREALTVVTPYKVEVVQGNVVSREQVDALKTGMSREQVRELLGTSLLTDVFHADRWDYVFTIDRPGVALQRSSVALFFAGDSLDHVVADHLYAEQDFVSLLDPRRRSNLHVPELKASAEELERFSRSRTVTAGTEPTTKPPLPASYPPLKPLP
jgi:outer membrane protein assembly factor BamE